MALIHKLAFKTVQDMVREVAEVYDQFNAVEPIPVWWKKFTEWVVEVDIDDFATLSKKLEELADKPAKERPAWWKKAEKAFKAADTARVLVLKTDTFEGEDPDEDLEVSVQEEEVDPVEAEEDPSGEDGDPPEDEDPAEDSAEDPAEDDSAEDEETDPADDEE